MNRIARTQHDREQQTVVPPKEALQAMLAQVNVLIERKQQIVEGIAVFQDGARKFIATLPPTPPDAIQNMQDGLLAIAKGHAGIILAEMEELKSTVVQMEAQLATYDRKITLPQ